MSSFDAATERKFLTSMVDGLEWTIESPSVRDVDNKPLADVNESCRLRPSKKSSTASGEPRFLINGHGMVAGLKGARERVTARTCDQ